jgi:phosphoglycolate phosphatase-like HAD superfamily hydrolase
VHAPDSDHGSEPKTVTLTRALAALLPAAEPSRAVMVGDRHHDVAAGRACGTFTVGVTWGAGDRAELTAAGADRVVDTPGQLAALFG